MDKKTAQKLGAVQGPDFTKAGLVAGESIVNCSNGELIRLTRKNVSHFNRGKVKGLYYMLVPRNIWTKADGVYSLDSRVDDLERQLKRTRKLLERERASLMKKLGLK